MLLLALVTLVLSGPPSLAATAPVGGAIVLERAVNDVRALTREAGQIGSEGNAARRRYIIEQLAACGVQAEVQAADAVVSLLGRTVAAHVHNVVARIPGREPGPAVLLSAHYDAVPNSPGAADDAAGVATLLETTRALRALPQLRRDVVLLFSDGEELGLLGAEAFVSEHPLARKLGWALNFEARGSRGASAMYETSLPNAGLVAHFARSVPRPVGNSLISSLSRVLPNDTDFTVFRRAGIPGFAFAFADGFVDYHRETDSLERLDPRSLAHHLSHALALTRELAEASAPPGSGARDAAYFDVLGRWLVSTPTLAVHVLGVLLVLSWLIVRREGRRQSGVRTRGELWGVCGSLASLLCGILAVALLDWLLAQVLPVGRRIDWAGGLLVAHVSLALLVSCGIYRWLLGRASGAELELGTLGTSVFVVVLLNQLAPGMSYAPLWVTAFALGGWWWRHVRQRRASLGPSAVGGSAAALVPAVFFVINVGYAFFVLMGTQLPAIMALVVTWGASLFLPWSAPLWQPRARRAAAALGALVAGTVAGAMLLHALRPAPPVFTDLSYALDLGTRRARWSASTGGSEAALVRLVRGAPPPLRALPGSELSLVEREPLDAKRYRVELLLRLAPGARCVTLTQLGGGRVLESRVNGHAPHPNVRFSPELDKKLWQLATGQRLSNSFNLYYCGSSPEPVRLELITAGRGLFLDLTDVHDGLPAGLLDLRRLGPELRFDANGNRTLVEHRVQL